MKGRRLRFAHIADIHLSAQSPDTKGIVDVLNSARPPFDFVVSGGDNTREGANSDYEAFIESFSGLNVPLFAVRGNHDRGRFGHYRERYLPSPRSEPADPGSKD